MTQKLIKKCSVEGCNHEYLSKGYCNMHYKRFKESGKAGPIESLKIIGKQIPKLCSVENCLEEHCAKGYCDKHYRQFKIHGNVISTQFYTPRAKQEPKICGIENCKEECVGLGYCNAHYKRFKSTGDPMETLREINKTVGCKIEGCDNKHKGKGYCIFHYDNLRRHGDPNYITTHGSGSITDNGYRIISVNNIQMKEHRHFMEQHLGRKLTGTENVHHRNGDKLDNSIGPCALLRECKCESERHNLELWPTPQPAGKRVEDLLDYADYIYELYGKNRQK